MGKEKRQREKKKREITARKLIGILIVLAGIGVFCYPLCVQAYNAYEQKKMIEEFRENIAAAQVGMAAADDGENSWKKGGEGEGEPVTGTEIPAMAEQPDGKQTPEGIGPPDGIKHPKGTEPSEGIELPEGIENTDGIEAADGTELPAGTGLPVAEPGQIEAPQDGGQGNQENAPEGTSGEGQEENPEEGTQGEETRPDRLNGNKVIGLIEIEAISLIYPIVEGAETENIGVAIGHMPDTAEFGAIGNCALAGHRGGYSGPYFKKLDELKAGDEVVITNAKGQEFVYKVTESMVVEPTDVWVAEDTGEGKALLTLITCEEDGGKRLVVRCELIP